MQGETLGISSSGTRGAFDASVIAWRDYSRSVYGELRSAEAIHHLRAHLKRRGLRVLDVGSGTGELAADLARDGHSVTILDFSPGMLEEAGRVCQGLDVMPLCADVSQIEGLFEPGSFDVAVCHSLLEFVGDVPGVVSQLARVLKVEGVLSVLVGNRYHATVRTATVERDFERARLALDVEAPSTDVFGLPRRTFYPKEIQEVLKISGLRVIAEYGVRVFYDLLGSTIDSLNRKDLDNLLDLELAAGARMPYRHIGRFVQFIALRQ